MTLLNVRKDDLHVRRISLGEKQNGREMACDATEDRFSIESYQITIRRVTKADRTALHELVVGVFWPHRARDIDMFLSLGQGYLAVDEIDRPVGAGMAFPMGADFAMIGMMVTAPRLQTLGVGRRILQRLREDCGERDLRLSATRDGYRLYESEGFVPLAHIFQHQGTVHMNAMPAPVAGVEIRAMRPEDHADILALDAEAYGGRRETVLDVLLAAGTGIVARRDGRLCGYALLRDFGRGQVIGPVVADDDPLAISLCAPLIRRCEGRFLRLDTPHHGGRFSAFLTSVGLVMYDIVTEMHTGRQRRPTTGEQLYGLAAQALG